MTSVGCRSGVHWIRDGATPSMLPAIARASTVLAVPGDVLEQHVPAAHERREDELDLLALAVDDRLDVVEQAGGDLDRRAEALLPLLEIAVDLGHPGLVHGADPSRTVAHRC